MWWNISILGQFLGNGNIRLLYILHLWQQWLILLYSHPGNELPSELVQTLIKMEPTSDEELQLSRLYNGDLSRHGKFGWYSIFLQEMRILALYLQSWRGGISGLKNHLLPWRWDKYSWLWWAVGFSVNIPNLDALYFIFFICKLWRSTKYFLDYTTALCIFPEPFTSSSLSVNSS